MSVPETTVDKDACTVFTKDDIWMAGQSTVIETITETPGMQPAADNHLRPGIGRVNRRHVGMTLLWGHRVHTAVIYLRTFRPWKYVLNASLAYPSRVTLKDDGLASSSISPRQNT